MIDYLFIIDALSFLRLFIIGYWLLALLLGLEEKIDLFLGAKLQPVMDKLWPA